MRKIAIIDDDLESIDSLVKLLNLLDIRFELVGTANNVKDGISLLNNIAIDLLFLDIEMPDGTGFDLIDQLDNLSFQVIFFTAHNQYAVKAFRYAALDYLMKPVNVDELEQALRRLDEAVPAQTKEQINFLLENHKAKEKFKRLAVSTTEGVYYYNIDQLIRFEADGRYTTIYPEDKKPIMASKNIKEYESILPNNFLRVHKSHLVNITYVDAFDASESILKLKDKSKVLVSRRRKQQVLELISLQ